MRKKWINHCRWHADMNDKVKTAPSCALDKTRDSREIETVSLSPHPSPADYRDAMRLAEKMATQRLGSAMLISWYDADRDFESPQHAGECHLDSATPGYVDYALYRDASLKIDIEQGRFVFFYLKVDLQS